MLADHKPKNPVKIDRSDCLDSFGQLCPQPGEVNNSPAALARGFNRRYAGKPVSNYAARKWLLGEAIPGQDKLRVLAQWLGVANDWLRFGEGECSSPQDSGDKAHEIDYDLMRAISTLSPEHQTVVQELVRALRRAEEKPS
jgi:transcriptional regulator with XRE-family HTH domain